MQIPQSYGLSFKLWHTLGIVIYQALRVVEAREQTGRKYTIISGSQAAIRRAAMDSLGPGQQWARAIVEVADRVMARGNEISIIWVPAHRGVPGNEVVDGMAKTAAGDTSYGSRPGAVADKPPPFSQKGHRAQDAGHHPVGQEPCPPGATVPPPGRLRAPTEDAQKGPQVNSTAVLPAAVREPRDWILPVRPDDRRPATGDGRVLVVQLRKEAVGLRPVYGVLGVVAADPRLVEEDRKGVPLGAPEGTGFAMVVEGGSHRGGD